MRSIGDAFGGVDRVAAKFEQYFRGACRGGVVFNEEDSHVLALSISIGGLRRRSDVPTALLTGQNKPVRGNARPDRKAHKVYTAGKTVNVERCLGLIGRNFGRADLAAQ